MPPGQLFVLARGGVGADIHNSLAWPADRCRFVAPKRYLPVLTSESSEAPKTALDMAQSHALPKGWRRSVTGPNCQLAET